MRSSFDILGGLSIADRSDLQSLPMSCRSHPFGNAETDRPVNIGTGNSILRRVYLRIGRALVLGILVQAASAFGLALLLSSNFPAHHGQFWQYFGAALDHSVFGFCFWLLSLGEAI